jgi:hypothetical protein
MCERHGSLSTGHNREDEIVAIFTAVVDDGLPPQQIADEACSCFGFRVDRSFRTVFGLSPSELVDAGLEVLLLR